MAKLRARLRDENGEVMLESTLVMTFTLFVLMAMISVGFLFYQQAMVSTVASDIAVDIASSYKLTDQEMGSGQVSPDALNDVKLYRTSVAMASMKALHRQRAEEYLPERVRLTSLGILDKEPVLDHFDITVDNVGRMHVEVGVSMECEILFGGALEYLGLIDSTPSFSASGRAECLDVTAYASHVQFLEYVGSKVKGTAVDEALKSILEIFENADSIADMLLGGTAPEEGS